MAFVKKINMKKIIIVLVISLVGVLSNQDLKAQSVEESCQIIETEVKDGIYSQFSVNSNGYLTYVWKDKKNDSETVLTIDLTKVTVSKDVSQQGYRVYINCIDGIDCINEKGKLKNDETYFSDFSKTYLPAKDEKGMTIMYNHLLFLLKLGNTNR